MEAAYSDVLPSAMLLEICLANPDATRSDEFSTALQYDIPTPLPQYMLDLIIANWDVETPLTLLESQLSELYHSMRRTNTLFIQEALFDTIGK